jgi:pyruvate/2-oxoglutarate dehydrogenase complex dihydrolipoamide dehydrogenase (E3) component
LAYDYDMIVIGGGAAGLVASGMSAVLGAKTALIEEHRLGGDCTWTGCVPSKALLRAAKVAHQTRVADRYGLLSSSPQIDFRRVMEHARDIRNHIYEKADAPPNLEKLGVAVIPSRARFTSPHEIELTDHQSRTSRLSSRYFVIGTGSSPRMPQSNAPLLTNENLFELNELPRRLLVLGAGPIGVEMAQAFRRLGSEVAVVAPGNRILPKDEPELTELLRQALEEDGIAFHLGHKVVNVERLDGALAATLDNATTLACDAVLAAIGRQPVVQGLGLEAAGVAVNKGGIQIDRHCRTSQRHIYASGDVTGRHMFTHMAEHMSKIAVSNAILHAPLSIDDDHVTWCTYTEPELARVGASEEGLRKRGLSYSVYPFPFAKLDRAITDSETAGLIKVLAGRGGRILGVSIVGANAGEMIGEWALAMKNGLKLKQVADTIHPYPTYVLGNRRAADQWYTKQLASPLLGLLAKVFRYRGVRKREIDI